MICEISRMYDHIRIRNFELICTIYSKSVHYFSVSLFLHLHQELWVGLYNINQISSPPPSLLYSFPLCPPHSISYSLWSSVSLNIQTHDTWACRLCVSETKATVRLSSARVVCNCRGRWRSSYKQLNVIYFCTCSMRVIHREREKIHSHQYWLHGCPTQISGRILLSTRDLVAPFWLCRASTMGLIQLSGCPL